MPNKRFDVRYNPRLRKYIQKLLQNEKIKELLAYYHLSQNEQGVARLALILLLKDSGVGPGTIHTGNGNTAT